MAYIISSLSRDTEYAFYTRTSENMVSIQRKILIKGGANVTNKKTLITPHGVTTEVSDEELALLKQNLAFKEHLERGFVKIVESDNKYKAQEQADESTLKDKSAQLTDKDYQKKGKKAPRKGKVD